ncbi:MAG: HEAT repeat domain-containing protein, partial [Gemmataceae bacterium]
EEVDRAGWVEYLAPRSALAVGPLLDCLTCPNERDSQNALAALDFLGRSPGSEGSGPGDIAGKLVRAFPRLDPTVQAGVLRLASGWVSEGDTDEDLRTACCRLLEEAAVNQAVDVHTAGLVLADLLAQREDSEGIAAARTMIQTGLRSSSAEVRLESVRLSVLPNVQLVDQVVGLLRDPEVEVRRSAIIAVGPENDSVSEDVLLPGLHDSDAEVRHNTEAALKSRGLRPKHLEMGRMLSHPQAKARLQVLDLIRDLLDGGQEEVELDPGVWLRRLSHDDSPAIRAAALRLISQQSVVDLNDRLDQMARSDPSPTVAQLAHFYLRGKRSPEPQPR